VKRWERFEPAYAVVRTDLPVDGDTPWESFSVKEIMWSAEDAEAEVERLNALKAEKDARYELIPTRVERRQTPD
jgi:hypothetical protein